MKMQTCKIMTFNMRTQTTNDGDNQFFLRAPYIKERLDKAGRYRNAGGSAVDV